MDNGARRNRALAFWGAMATAMVVLVCAGAAFSLSANSCEAYAENSGNSTLSDASAKTTFYFTNDVHGNFAYSLKTNGMSYATAKALKAAGNEVGNKAYLVDAGDHVSGSSYANYDLGKSVLQIMADVGYDFRVPGNHEFDYGSKTFLQTISKQAKYYACNFYYGNTSQRGENILDSYKVFDGANGEKIALIGIMTPETISASAPGYFQDDAGNWTMYIDNATQPTQDAIYSQLNATIEDVKSTIGSDTICIAVGHLGNETSAVSAGIDSTTVIKKSHGLSAFIDGHSHTIENETVKDADEKPVKLLQAASGIEASSKTETTGINRIGALTISSDGTVSGEILSATDGVYSAVTPDATLQQKESAYITSVETALSKNVATNSIEFAAAAKNIVRAQSNSLADYVADAVYYYTNTYPDSKGTTWGCDLSIVNGGAIRSTFEPGTLSLYSFLAVCPFVNKLAVVEVTGQQILDALEYGAKDAPTGTFGGFMQVSGLTYSIRSDIESTVQMENGLWAGPPTGEYKVCNVQVYDKSAKAFKDIDLDKTYRLAGTDYIVANFGDGFMMFRGATKLSDYSGLLHYQALAQYAKDFKKDASAQLTESATDEGVVGLVSSDGLSNITSANSPLSSLEGFPINYESKEGAKRITSVTHSDPQDDEGGSSSASLSAATGDTSGAFIFGAALAAVAAGAVLFTARRRFDNQ